MHGDLIRGLGKKGGDVSKLVWKLLPILLFAYGSCYSQLRMAHGTPPPRNTTQIGNANGTLPKECLNEAMNPWMDALCKYVSRGRPQPAGSWLNLPAYGSTESIRSGYACMGGLAMHKIKNGWEQVLDINHNYYRCNSF